MWIYSKSGFVSIVEHFDDPDILVVRARVLDDLTPFMLAGYKPVHTPTNDYSYRLLLPRPHVASVVLTLVSKIDYSNFKGTIKDNKRHDIYLRVWAASNALTNLPPSLSMKAGAK